MTITETSASTTVLRIDSVPAGRGCIGVTFAPGKRQPISLPGQYDRDLAADLDVVAQWNAAAVITLLTQKELDALSISNIGDGVWGRFMDWRHFPVEDVHTPTTADHCAWVLLSYDMRAVLEAGNRIVVHCRGGVGRAPMVAARLMVELGADPEDAIAALRQARHPKAVETCAQED